jgi:hypothetical protein
MVDPQDNDEIDLKQLIKSVIDTRLWVLVSLVLVSGLYWGLQTMASLARPTVLSFETRINLVFTGTGENQYPNGSPFSMSDVVAPVVLHRVYEQNELGQFIELQPFLSSFSVRPHTPDREIILAKYSSQLESKNLSVAEIEQLQSGLNDELTRASSKAITLTFTGAGLAEIPMLIIEKIMRDVPTEWARHMVEDIGVAEFRASIYTSEVLDETILAEMDYMIAFEMLLDRVSLLQKNIEVIKQLPNGLVVSDEDTGLSVPDLEKAVEDVQRYRIAPLLNPVRTFGIARDPQLVDLYFKNELVELDRKLEVYIAKKGNVSDAYLNYIQSTSGRLASSNPSNNSVTTQIEPGFFDKIVELTNSGADIKYRQNLNTLYLNASDRISETQAEIARIEEILKSLETKSDKDGTLRDSYSIQLTEQLPAIVTLLVKYFEVSERLYKKLSAENLGRPGEIFRFADGQSEFKKSGSILSSTNLRLYLIFCFLTVLLVIPIVMIRASLRKE